MADAEQMDISDVLKEMRDAPMAVGGHHRRIIFCLRHWASKGLHLCTCADSKHLNLSVRTLERYCREAKLRFPDYIPYELRTDEERRRGPRKT